ncbi:hypothetical protein DPSP01_013337 [Paraphaeosphaeria sporulosa]
MEMEYGPTKFDTEGRPYRSHAQPACQSCRKRKSRCKTRAANETCAMCQVHGTECIFPQVDNRKPRKIAAASRRVTARFNRSEMSTGRQGAGSAPALPPSPSPPFRESADQPLEHYTNQDIQQDSCIFNAHDEPQATYTNQEEPPAHLMGIFAEAGDHSTHIVSPAIAEDNSVLKSYLSSTPDLRNMRLIRAMSDVRPPNPSVRPVLFDTVLRRPLGVTTNQSLASSKCELIEKFIGPHVQDLIDLFFERANVCFPIFDDISFSNIFSTHKEKISSALLCNLYANALTYWDTSPRLQGTVKPDHRYIWVQANEALNSELFLSPGISAVISIILNVSGRPSTSIFGNGGMIGIAVALSNALGLNRDPSNWNISPPEKVFRIRIWWLVLVHDRWCSLAYGTPLQIHRAQHDVPIPTAKDICRPGSSSIQAAAASIFLALVSLTEILGRYLEHVYCFTTIDATAAKMSGMDFELLLTDWEDSLSDDVRRLAIRGTRIDVPGSANFRLAYLAVKLLLRRIQLDAEKDTSGGEATTSHYYLQAQRVAEEIVHLVQELDDSQCSGFWIPVNAFSLTSATIFLLRSALRSRTSMADMSRNTSLKLAKDMISALRAHHQNSGWDLAEHCLTNCSGLVDRMETAGNSGSATQLPTLEDLFVDMNTPELDNIFTGFGNHFEL